jgi:hypothetical protein
MPHSVVLVRGDSRCLFYELVLDFNGESAEEARLTDRPVEVGDTVTIDNQEWTVVRQLALRQRQHARFQCKRAEEMSDRNREMLERVEDLGRRAEEQRERAETGTCAQSSGGD